MDNFMDKLVEKINSQGTARSQSGSSSHEVSHTAVQMKPSITEEKLHEELREESAKLTEAVAALINDGNAKQVELFTEYKKQVEEASNTSAKGLRDALEDHVHKESVKCYRNTQAVLEEKATAVTDSVKSEIGGIRGLLIAILVLLILNFGAVAAVLAHMFGLF